MKKQIRQGVFETNSSSVHSLTMCSKEQFDKWDNNELLFNKWSHEFYTKEEVAAKLQYDGYEWNEENLEDTGFVTMDQFFDENYFETFCKDYTTSAGEKIVAVGYYGYDG